MSKILNLWIVRNPNGQLIIFGSKPFKNNDRNYWSVNIGDSSPIFSQNPKFIDELEFDSNFLNEIKWTDNEPKSITLKIS